MSALKSILQSPRPQNPSRPTSQAVDIIQAHLIHALFRHAIEDEFTIKGGQAIRAHGSLRSTKDIDLQGNPNYPLSSMQARVRRAIADISGSGLIDSPSVTEPKQTDTTGRWKLAGYLPATGAEFHMTLEISRRNQPDPKIVETKDLSLPGMSGDGTHEDGAHESKAVRIYTRQALAATKVAALCDDRRIAPRDIYDLYYLISTEVRSPAGLLAQAGDAWIDGAMASLWSKLDANNWQLCVDQLLPSLPDDVAKVMTPDVWDEVRIEVGETVEHWLKEAKTRAANPPAEDPAENPAEKKPEAASSSPGL